MNDLNLRVSGGIGEKVKKPAPPISMPYWTAEIPGVANDFFKNFLSCNSADNQLRLLKTFLNSHKEKCEPETIKFLVRLFWHAEAKHPVKGFLKKHISDSRTLCQPFTEGLSSVIAAEIKDFVNLPYGDYIGPVTRLDVCIDKFPPGAAAVSSLEIAVATYLVCCLESCIKTLGIANENIVQNEAKSDPLAPTEINKVYDLVHLTLRLLLYMIQKVTNENRGQISSMFTTIKSIITALMLGREVPMDTKSVSGIIYLTLHLFENGPESWITLLEEDRTEQSGTVNLAIYSAVATVVPPAELVARQMDGQPAVLTLTDHILAIGDEYSSESSHMLAVARTILSISRSLEPAGSELAERLARFCWAHMEHHTDSVRHLAAQAMGRVVRTCVRLHKAGDPSALDNLFASLSTLDCTRKSFYVTLTALAEELGGGVLVRRPDVIHDVIAALHTQAVQACATTFLETLLKKHMKESDTETIYQQWIRVILEAVKRESDPAVLGILERILAKAVQWDSGILDYILPSDRELSSYSGSDLKCVLLVLAVLRKAGVTGKPVCFRDLMHTACDPDDEIRILSLSLVAETPRSTEPFSRAELEFVLRFMEYNVNAQAPNFRQLVLARMKKILKRLEDSYKVLKRKETEHTTETGYYLKFVSELRSQCFASLVAGGNYGRRCTALQVAAWLHSLQMTDRTWTEEHAEILYDLLEDSYENNKALALQVLNSCPAELIKPVHKQGYLDNVLAQASSVRPTDSVAASYKLLLLISLPIHLEIYHDFHYIPEHKHYALLTRILCLLKEQAERAQDIARAARDAPMHGLVHCVTRLVGCLDVRAIAGNCKWSALMADVIATCEVVNCRVARVVNAASPEGLLPEELADQTADSSGGTRLSDGRAVTAQMVLLCGWRSVKETSLLLGCIASRLSIEGEDPAWTLSANQVEHVGDHLIELLSRVKHRGAFEQAYVGFTMLLGRLWKCSSSRLHQLPLQWFSSIERGFLLPAAAEDDPTAGEYCATRRGAGLPFMIQALVTTELATESTAPRGRLLARCLDLCLRVARSAPAPADAARAHLVLRALYRHTAPPAAPTAEAVMVAVRGFEADTWTERNSSTLLFSALTVRIFGVLRARSEKLCVRNRMTGRIFFLRYPQLYDFLLDQLKSVSAESTLRPSLFPTLLLLARLYPSALEGTVSNLKLERFLPHVVSLAGARDVSTRRLAARAAAPLVPPHRYVPHMLSLLKTLGDSTTKKNLCHGLLCQLAVLLALNSELTINEQSKAELLEAIRGTFWIAAQATSKKPCFIVADEWLKVLNLILLRFPKLLHDDLVSLSSHLETALFCPRPVITSGREIFLSKVVYMLLIMTKRDRIVNIVIQCLKHTDYEVNLSVLNYLLLLHGRNDDSCPFLEHLSKISQNDILEELEKDENYVKLLCNVSDNGYLECKQKALRVLSLTNDTQREIVKLKLGKDVDLTEADLVMELIDSIKNGHASLCSIYLDSLLRLVCKSGMSLDVIRVLHACSASGNEEETREAVVRFMEKNLRMLLRTSPSTNEAEMFEWSATLWASAAMLLEDDAPAVRQCAANAVLNALRDAETPSTQTLPSYAARQWLCAAAQHDDGPALLLLLASMDFRATVDTGDELGEECRVFDQNETHNVYLEEFTWTRDCAVELKRIYRQTYAHTHTIDEFLQSLLSNPTYKDTIEKLCIENVAECLTGNLKSSNPKIDLFLKILHK